MPTAAEARSAGAQRRLETLEAPEFAPSPFDVAPATSATAGAGGSGSNDGASRALLALLVLPVLAIALAALSPTVLSATPPTRALVAYRGQIAFTGLAVLAGALVGILVALASSSI